MAKQQRMYVFEGSVDPVQKIAGHVFPGQGLKIQELSASDLGGAHPGDACGMFRAVEDWSAKRKMAAFPTFGKIGEGYGKKIPVVCIEEGHFERLSATEEELWGESFDPLASGGHFLRVIHDIAHKRGAVTAFPTFHWEGDGRKRRYHLVAIKGDVLLYHELEVPEVGQYPPEDAAAWLRAYNARAVELGYAAGLANMHARDWHGHWGERNGLTRAEQDLNHLLEHEGWEIARVDFLKISTERAAALYLLEKEK